MEKLAGDHSFENNLGKRKPTTRTDSKNNESNKNTLQLEL